VVAVALQLFGSILQRNVPGQDEVDAARYKQLWKP
jgi:hypothetical protein